MSRPDEGLIHQWLDGECTPEESARLDQLVATDPEWAAAVAEARGLIAASSRIVQSLDAVPRAMPAGSVAAPRVPSAQAEAARAPQRFTAKPWMRIAAAVVLVAGTAYVLRERTAEPFVPAASIDSPAPSSPPTTREQEQPPVGVPSNVPAIGPARVADRTVGEATRGATQSAPAPVIPPEQDTRKVAPTLPAAPVSSVPTALPPAPQPLPSAGASSGGSAGVGTRSVEEQRTRATEDSRGRASNLETQRRASLAADAPRGAIARTADAPSAAPSRAMTLLRLDGCWRVAAPPELVGVLSTPEIRRQHGDTLVLVTTLGDVVVVRGGDTLVGGLMARAEPCKE